MKKALGYIGYVLACIVLAVALIFSMQECSCGDDYGLKRPTAAEQRQFERQEAKRMEWYAIQEEVARQIKLHEKKHH